MRTFNKLVIFALVLVNANVSVRPLEAAQPNCTQNRVDGSSVPLSKAFIYPAQSVIPFYQWENNNGYCGEVSMIQAGMNHGQWMSQFNARMMCGTGLSQSGPDGWCARHNNAPHYNAQMLLEDPGTGVTGPNVYASAGRCLANSRLASKAYPYQTGFHAPDAGQAGYQDYMTWVKKEVMAGHLVTLGVLWKYGTDAQYDHEVSVIKIGTNHAVSDPAYYSDDVLYLDDHGLYTTSAQGLGNSNPAVPVGAGNDMSGCTPYVFAYTFGSLGQTRRKASASSAQAYSILIPGVYPTYPSAGGDGYHVSTTPITGHNYGFSVSGAIDTSAGGPYLLPVQLTIPTATYTAGVANPFDAIAGWQYENSMIGTSVGGTSCTNVPPQYPMSPYKLQAKVSGLTAGITYNLYEYDFSGVTGTGTEAALAVPSLNFNANKAMATHATQFVATGPTFSQTVTRASSQIVIFRAVPTTAP